MQFLQRVFSIDTIVKPLPASMAYNVSRNLNFFTRIFTQFFGKFICLLFVGAKMMEHLREKKRKNMPNFCSE